jgi:hypothetical protein
MFKLAELFVDIGTNDKGLKQGLANAKAMIGGMAGKLAMVAGAVGGGAFLYKAVQQASTLNETMNKVGVIFGSQTSRVTGQAEQMAKSFGLSKNEMLDAAANFGLMAQNAGMAKDSAATFANVMVKAAADASSFSNTNLADALAAIQAGLRGSGEPLQRYGVFLDEVHTDAMAAAMGFRKYGGTLKDNEKLIVRQMLIMRGLGAALGDLERTADQSANIQKKMFGQLTNITEQLGTILLPVWDDIVRTLSGALGSIQDFLADNADAISAWVNTAITRGQAFKEAFSSILDSSGIGAMFQTLAQWALWAGEQLGLAFDFMIENGAALYDSFTTYLADSGIGGMFESIGDWAVWMGDQISQAFATVSMLIRNWPQVWEIAKIKVQEFFLNLVELAKWGFNATMQLASWFGSNWFDVLKTGLNAATSLFTNFYKNIRDLAKASWDYITSMGKSGFNFTMTPLLDGFKNEIKQLPEIAGPQLTSLANLVEQETDKITAKETERLAKPTENEKDATKKADKKTTAQPGYQAEAPLERTRQVETMGLADFAKKLQEKAFGGNLDQQQLAATQQVAANTAKIANKPEPVAVASP